MVKFRGRTAIRSSERRRAEEKNSRVTLVLEVSSKPGPLQSKGSATLIRPSLSLRVLHPPPYVASPAQACADRHPDSPLAIAEGAPPATGILTVAGKLENPRLPETLEARLRLCVYRSERSLHFETLARCFSQFDFGRYLQRTELLESC